MPRVSHEQSDRNRVTIVNAASRLFREKGLNGISVADVMAAAGLTHGGFYGHFESKDELAAVACRSGFVQTDALWARRFSGLPDAPARRRSYVEDYLSTASRDEAGSACTVAALAGDVAREPQDKLVRAAYLESAKAMTARLASLSPMDRDGADRRSRALAEMAMLVGAQMIARATRGDPMSQEILSSTRAYLLADAPANDEPSR